MTATEYLDARKRYTYGWILPALIVAFAMMVMGMNTNWDIVSVGDALRLILLIAGLPLGTIVLFGQGAYFFQRRFERRHPEMADLNQWERYVGSVESYPVDDADRIAQMPRARMLLENSARAANAAIAARKQVAGLFNDGPADSPETVTLSEIHKHLGGVASEHMMTYNALWHLLVEKRRVLTGGTYRDARKFRESFGRRGAANHESEIPL